MKKVFALILTACMLASCVISAQAELAESFADPGTDTSMRIRVWWPSADISDEMIRYEVQEIAQAGIAGMEVVAIAEGYDTTQLDAETDGWGTEEWIHAMEVLVDEASNYDLVIDMTIGPRWPASVPGVDVNSDYVSKKILTSTNHIEVDDTQAADYTIPAAPESSYDTSLVAVVVVKTDTAASTEETVTSAGPGGSTVESTMMNYAIYSDTLTRIADDQIDETSGTFSWTPAQAGEWTVFSFWMTSVGQTAGDTVPTAYVVDHFSVGGTQLILDYWDNTLTDTIKDYWAENGGGIFEDSLEVSSSDISWSVELEDYFMDNYGYDICLYLPLLVSQSTAGNLSEKYTAIDDDAINAEVLSDYLNNLSDMYIENHIDVIVEWCHGYGLTYRAQAQGTGDSDWVEPAHSEAHVDIMEGETLGMGQSPDAFRTLSGSASLSGTEIISCEYGAEFGAGYQVTWQWLLELLHRNVMVGANQFNLHGFASRAQWTDSTYWPGWMPFDQPRFSEAWNEAQTVWEYMETGFVDYVSRIQTFMQYGTRQADFAVYRDCGMRTDAEGTKDGVLYLDGDNPSAENPLTMIGYSYHYVSPSNFDLELAVVEDGIFAPDAAGYQALVIYDQDAMELATAQTILGYAQAGLKIILVGQIPQKDGTYSGDDDEAVIAVFDEMLSLENVYSIATEDELPAALAEAGVEPDISYDSNYLVTQHHSGDDADLYYIYNTTTSRDYYNSFAGPGDDWDYYDADAEITTAITMIGTGQPYQFNAWTGEITPILEYTDNGDGTITVELTIEDCEAVLIGIAEPGVFGDFFTPDVELVTGDGEILSVDDSVVYRTDTAGDYSVIVDGTEISGTVDAVAQAMSLDEGWTLNVTSWEPGETAQDMTAEDYNATDVAKVDLPAIELDTLTPWAEIEGLENISGRGLYTTTFTLEGEFTGAYLDLGQRYDSILQVIVNGVVMEAANQYTYVLDLSGVVTEGENTLTVLTGTTLAAAIRAIGGNCNTYDFHGSYPTTYGLLGGVTLTPFVDVTLAAE